MKSQHKSDSRTESCSECSDHDGHCDTHPEFAVDENGEAKAVLLDKACYVRLLIDARVTQLDCWPPGTQSGAKILQRIAEIEEAGQQKHGSFKLEKLSQKLQDEYFHLNMALDEFQDELQIELQNDSQLPDQADLAHTSTIMSEMMKKMALKLANDRHDLSTWSQFSPTPESENFA